MLEKFALKVWWKNFVWKRIWKSLRKNVAEFVCVKWKMENGKKTEQNAESVCGYVA